MVKACAHWDLGRLWKLRELKGWPEASPEHLICPGFVECFKTASQAIRIKEQLVGFFFSPFVWGPMSMTGLGKSDNIRTGLYPIQRGNSANHMLGCGANANFQVRF